MDRNNQDMHMGFLYYVTVLERRSGPLLSGAVGQNFFRAKL